MQFSLLGSAVRGMAIALPLGVLNYLWGFGHGEAIADMVLGSVVLTLLLYAHGRTRPLLRRLANRNAKPS